uniref:Uncharacterized protein n=1 Tax=Rhizophora mucronata TaxID=61149 RepID=A0A2P2NF40_RHIMU
MMHFINQIPQVRKKIRDNGLNKARMKISQIYQNSSIHNMNLMKRNIKTSCPLLSR